VALALTLAAALAGCASPLSTRSGEVLVTTGSGTPVEGATVRADPLDPHHPLNVADYFRGDAARLGVWTTGVNGRARIELLSDRPTEVSVLAPGYLPTSRVIDPGEPEEASFELVPLQPATGTSRP